MAHSSVTSLRSGPNLRCLLTRFSCSVTPKVRTNWFFVRQTRRSPSRRHFIYLYWTCRLALPPAVQRACTAIHAWRPRARDKLRRVSCSSRACAAARPASPRDHLIFLLRCMHSRNGEEPDLQAWPWQPWANNGHKQKMLPIPVAQLAHCAVDEGDIGKMSVAEYEKNAASHRTGGGGCTIKETEMNSVISF